ncbi:MAG: DUF2252 family protein [Alphaproteobacteria bacterium]|nr:DUF2252 family protein [Alphaproteobacteria bacterium]
MTAIAQSMRDYDDWLRARLGSRFVADDLAHKHKLMRKEAFAFLRGTCFRWAETAPQLCPDLLGAPEVPSVIDSHVGNFGLWSDVEGRLVWGVNDYDEAAAAAWPFDLVRLAASALVAAGKRGCSAAETEDAILDGYAVGIARPRPYVLERERGWLRELFAASPQDREDFWAEILALPKARRRDGGFVAALRGALPERGADVAIAHRRAGVGSLGRLRLVAATAAWRGGPLAREAKAAVPSCWAPRGKAGTGYAYARGRFRTPDPWLKAEGEIVVRRLAPNSRKLDLEELRPHLRRRLLRAMARDIAGVHAGGKGGADAVKEDLARRGGGWLAQAATAVAAATERDWKAWRG